MLACRAHAVEHAVPADADAERRRHRRRVVLAVEHVVPLQRVIALILSLVLFLGSFPRTLGCVLPIELETGGVFSGDRVVHIGKQVVFLGAEVVFLGSAGGVCSGGGWCSLGAPL